MEVLRTVDDGEIVLCAVHDYEADRIVHRSQFDLGVGPSVYAGENGEGIKLGGGIEAPNGYLGGLPI
jgi:hypothetical protein